MEGQPEWGIQNVLDDDKTCSSACRDLQPGKCGWRSSDDGQGYADRSGTEWWVGSKPCQRNTDHR